MCSAAAVCIGHRPAKAPSIIHLHLHLASHQPFAVVWAIAVLPPSSCERSCLHNNLQTPLDRSHAATLHHPNLSSLRWRSSRSSPYLAFRQLSKMPRPKEFEPLSPFFGHIRPRRVPLPFYSRILTFDCVGTKDRCG